MYIKSGSSELEIYDDNGSITFDHKETWGGITFEAEAYAVEGVLNEAQNAIASYVLLVKGIETDLFGCKHNILDDIFCGYQWIARLAV